MKTDHSLMKLGKAAPSNDPRTFLMGAYLTSSLPTPPAQLSYNGDIGATAWGMMANDRLGDCTIAAVGHAEMAFTDDSGKLFTPTDEQIIEAYSAITGYNPETGANDDGAVETDVLNFWRKKGIAGHKIKGYVALEPKSHVHVQQGLDLFGAVYIGLALPLSAQTQEIWDVPAGGLHGNGEPGSWGGHAVLIIGYDTEGLTLITWGQTKKMTWKFWDAYCDESYAVISTDFTGTAKHSKAINGFDLTQLEADLKLLKTA